MIARTMVAALLGIAFVLLVSDRCEPLAAQQPFQKFKQGGFFKKADPKAEPKAGAIPEPGEIPADQLAFFEKKIRPVLVNQCYSCHNAETPKGPKGGLILDTRAGLLKGGDNGPAVVAGNAKKSLIIQAMRGDNGMSQMPPKEKLNADVVADFEKWISMGAPDPRSGKAVNIGRTIDIEKGKEHWAFQPVKTAAPPKASAWATSPIDQYVEAKQKEQKLAPVVDADKNTLVRRAYFDIIGLPPTPEQVRAFVKDDSPDAFAKLVDGLLASPHFGEKWGRHWLDIARYAESSGKEQNMVYPFAWRYRDYVIDAFNKDKPYDLFLKEQLAGDLLSSKNDTDKAEKLIATGFLAIGAKSHNERNRQQFQLDLADEQIDVMGQAMLGLTIACARCHDHKFDPIPTKDYYAIAGIFMSTETMFGTAAGIQARQSAPLASLPKEAELPIGQMLSKSEVERMRTRLADLKTQREKQIEEARKNPGVDAQILMLGVIQQIGTMEKQLSYFDAENNPKKMAMAAQDRTFARDMPIHIRGELNKLGEVVPRGMLQVLSTSNTRIPRNTSGRKELAEWVASPKNPLTARVMANRVWLHLFGAGIVTTPDNFGTMGQAPSHPELLDYLAGSFVKNGWSIKKLIRETMLSRTYRLASQANETNVAIDPDNVYLWRMSKRRLSAEAIRDSMLAISGELNTKPPQGSPLQKYEGNVQQIGRFSYGMGRPGMGSSGGLESLTNVPQRSVYLPIVRDNVPESLELFDFAEPSLVTGSRDETSVPSQGLYLLNNPQVLKLADRFAESLTKKSLSDTERIDMAFRAAFARPATETEAKAAEAFIKKMAAAEGKGFGRKTAGERAAWSAFAQALFAAAEFRYLD